MPSSAKAADDIPCDVEAATGGAAVGSALEDPERAVEAASVYPCGVIPCPAPGRRGLWPGDRC